NSTTSLVPPRAPPEPGSAVTRSRTVGDPAAVSCDRIGALVNAAACPGRSTTNRLAAIEERPAIALMPGTPLIEAGLPPGGFEMVWGPPCKGTSCRVVTAVPSPG